MATFHHARTIKTSRRYYQTIWYRPTPSVGFNANCYRKKSYSPLLVVVVGEDAMKFGRLPAKASRRLELGAQVAQVKWPRRLHCGKTELDCAASLLLANILGRVSKYSLYKLALQDAHG